MLRTKYPPREFVFMEQIPNGTGAACSSWVDAGVVSLWPSNGIWWAAFEVKVSRADFLNELKNPGKNAWAKKSFHQFWYVAPKDVVKESELPEGCGWMYPRGNVLCIGRHASMRENIEINEVTVATLARAMHKDVEKNNHAALKAAMRDDSEFRDAFAHKQAVSAFLSRNGDIHYYGGKKEAIEEALEKTMAKDSKVEQDRAHVMYCLGQFQRRVLDLLQIMLPLAHHSLLARDESGKHVVSSWGGEDEGEIKALIDKTRGKYSCKWDVLLKQFLMDDNGGKVNG